MAVAPVYVVATHPAEAAGVATVARPAVAAGWLVAFFLVVSRTVSRTSRPDGLEHLLTAVDVRTIVWGTLTAEFARAVLVIGPAVLAGGVALAVRTGRPAVAVTVLAAGAGWSLSVLAAGFLCGLAITLALERTVAYTGSRLAVAVAAGLVFVAAAGIARGVPVETTWNWFAGLPTGWYGDLAVVVLDGAWTRAVGALALTVIVVSGSAVLAAPVGARLWFADPPTPTTSRDGRGQGWTAPFQRAVSRPTAAVGRTVVRQALRAPSSMTYVIFPIGGFASAVLVPGTRAEHASYALVYLPLYAAWASGAGIALNPLGDQREVLPLTLTSGISGLRFVGGYVLAGSLLGLPPVVGAAVAIGVAGGIGPLHTGVVVLVGAVLVVGGTAAAAAIGTKFPRYRPTRALGGEPVVVPSKAAFGAFSALVILLALPGTGVLVVLLPAVGPTTTDVPRLLAFGIGLQTAVAGLVGVASCRYTASRFERLDLGRTAHSSTKNRS